MPASSYILYREPNETDAEWAARLELALDTCRTELLRSTMIHHHALGELGRVTRIAETQTMDNWGASHASAPVIRQHNAIVKWIQMRLAVPADKDRNAVAFMANVLEIEVPDAWLADPE
jgi:hypothetical protein